MVLLKNCWEYANKRDNNRRESEIGRRYYTVHREWVVKLEWERSGEWDRERERERVQIAGGENLRTERDDVSLCSWALFPDSTGWRLSPPETGWQAHRPQRERERDGARGKQKEKQARSRWRKSRRYVCHVYDPSLSSIIDVFVACNSNIKQHRVF